MQGIVKLPLEAPLELRIVEIPGMQVEVVRVNRNALIFELDDDFDPVALGAGREIQQRMFVEAKLLLNPLES